MPTGRKRLKPEVRAERRQESLQRYAENFRDKVKASGPASVREHRAQVRETAARYRESHRADIRVAAALRRAKNYIEADGLEAFEEKRERPHMARTQRKHERRAPPPRLRTLPQKPKRRAPTPCSSDEDHVDGDDEHSDASDKEDSDDTVPQAQSFPRRVLPEGLAPQRGRTTHFRPARAGKTAAAGVLVSVPLPASGNCMAVIIKHPDSLVKKKRRPPAQPIPPGSAGSSSNPVLVDENGRIVSRLVPDRPKPLPPKKQRSHPYVLVPSRLSPLNNRHNLTLPAEQEAQDRHHRAARELANLRIAAQARLATAVARERLAPPDPPPAATPVRKPRRCDGARVTRREPLSDTDLYLTAARPPLQPTDRNHHECAICLNLKSHPVLYPCGHGYCFVCTRKWLEISWECPECRGVVTSAPILNLDVKAAIDFEHPGWSDTSRVSLTWDGLTFPQITP
ncbi:hypothetical protein C8R43DRAFT_1138102 [Mycena crocata]|nr:hypothetical protein C8R43DRAFT_1138102 [Mycena crocata]